MSRLSEISEDLSALASQAERSVVTLHTGPCSAATAVVWSPTVIVTAAHGLRREEGLEVSVRGVRSRASLLGIDPASDLAAVSVEAELTPLAATEARDFRLGELVLALSRSSDGVRARLGILGRVGGEWRLPGGARIAHYLESDLVPAPGWSGGPLLRANGQWIGLNFAGLVRGALLCLPLVSVRRIVDSLVTHGRVRRAHLGVGVQSVELPRSESTEGRQRRGLMVSSVMPGSAAAAAGLLLGDILLDLDGTHLQQIEDLQAVLSEERIDSDATLELVRGGVAQRLRVRLSARPG